MGLRSWRTLRRRPGDGPVKAAGSFWVSRLAAQLRQLGDIGRDPPCLVRLRPIARQAVRRGDYVGNRGECGNARLASEDYKGFLSQHWWRRCLEPRGELLPNSA
jgi:hypothetical protein